STYNILLLHQLIQGSKVEHFTFNHGNNVIAFSDIPLRFHLIAVGHVHRFQFLYSLRGRINSSHTHKQVIQDIDQNKWKFNKRQYVVNNQFPIICYPGSCERVSMMERNEKKGYIIGCIDQNISKAFLEFYPLNCVPMLKMNWDQSNKSLENLILLTFTKIHQLAKISRLKELGGVLRVTASDSINPNSITRVNEFAKQKKVILNVSNYR
ncbi:MAG: hypothetical protein ACTSQ9_05905, partial [Candidatus Hodarchaeales archaeon]